MTETLSDSLPCDVEVLVEGVLKAACDHRVALATAESCTGGLLASVLTDVEGCSHVFERGFVVYTDAAKSDLLGVPADLIVAEGAVSEAVARAMAEGRSCGPRRDWPWRSPALRERRDRARKRAGSTSPWLVAGAKPSMPCVASAQSVAGRAVWPVCVRR